jgi:hypothetical protein
MKTAEFREFPELARLVQSYVHRVERPPGWIKIGVLKMTNTSISQRLLSVVAAFTMSAMLMVSYFHVPASHVVPGILA